MHKRKVTPSRTRYYKAVRFFEGQDPGDETEDDEREDPINGPGEGKTVNE